MAASGLVGEAAAPAAHPALAALGGAAVSVFLQVLIFVLGGLVGAALSGCLWKSN